MDRITLFLLGFFTLCGVGIIVLGFYYFDRLNHFTEQCYAQHGDRVETNRGMSCWDTKSGKRIFLIEEKPQT